MKMAWMASLQMRWVWEKPCSAYQWWLSWLKWGSKDRFLLLLHFQHYLTGCMNFKSLLLRYIILMLLERSVDLFILLIANLFHFHLWCWRQYFILISSRKTLNHSYSGGPRGDSRKFYPNNITMHFVGWRNRNSSLSIDFAFRRVSNGDSYVRY